MTSKITAQILVGCSGSGKSTYAKSTSTIGAVVTCRDDIRFSITGSPGWKGYKFTKTVEQRVTEIQRTEIASAAARKMHVIIADTNLNEKFRNELAAYCESLGFNVEYKSFPATWEELCERDRFRGVYSVGQQVLYKQWQNWLKYSGRKQYVPEDYLPKTICVDIDGTLAIMGDRSPFEWNRVGLDTIDQTVQQMVWDFKNRGYKIVILSGRDSICRSETYQWLYDNGIIYNSLHMREQGDMRKDNIIKEELFWNEVAPYYNVCVCIEDRPCMVRLWYDLGIPKVISVANPWLEF